MAVERPTLEAIITRVVNDIDSTNPDLLVKVTQSPMNVFARATAGLSHGMYGYADFLFAMSLPTKARGAYLDRWGELLGLIRKQPTKARPVGRFVTATSGDAATGDTLRRGDGVIYEVMGDTAIVAPYTDVTLIAVDAGSGGSVLDGAALTISPALTSIDTAVVIQGDAEGEDVETDAAYLVRILARLQNPPQGGSEADYIAWARAVAGVGDAWVLSANPPFVDVRVITNNPADLVPDAQLILDVQTYLDTRRQVTAIVVVAAAAVFTQNVVISGLTPDTPAMKTAIEASLEDFYGAPPIRNPGVTVYETALIAAIQNTTGVVTFTLVSPAGSQNYGLAGFPVFGTLTVNP